MTRVMRVALIFALLAVALFAPASALSRRVNVKRRNQAKKSLRSHKATLYEDNEGVADKLLKETMAAVEAGEDNDSAPLPEAAAPAAVDAAPAAEKGDVPAAEMSEDEDSEFKDALQKLDDVISEAQAGEGLQAAADPKVEMNPIADPMATAGGSAVLPASPKAAAEEATKAAKKGSNLGMMLDGFPIIPPYASPTTVAPAPGAPPPAGAPGAVTGAPGGAVTMPSLLDQVNEAVAATNRLSVPQKAGAGLAAVAGAAKAGEMPVGAVASPPPELSTIPGAAAMTPAQLTEAIQAQRIQMMHEMAREDSILQAETEASLKLQKATAAAAAKAMRDNITATKADMVAQAAAKMANHSHAEATRAINLLKRVHGAKIAKGKMEDAAAKKIKAQRELEIAKAAITRHQASLQHATAASASLEKQLAASDVALKAASDAFNTNSNQTVASVLAHAQAEDHASALALSSTMGVPVQPQDPAQAFGAVPATAAAGGAPAAPGPAAADPAAAAAGDARKAPGMADLMSMFGLMAQGKVGPATPAAGAAPAAPPARRRFFFF